MPDYKEHWFKSRDGLNLYARDYPCERACEQPAATVVCIPGLTRNSADFALLAEHLSGRFRVLAVDLRGRGKSDYDPRPENYQPGVYVDDIISLLDSLELSRVILIGTSLGGMVSMLLTAMQPERVSSVILNDIGPEVHQPGLERIKSYVRNRSSVNSWDEAIDKTREVLGAEYPNFSAADWEAFTANIYRQGEDGTPELDYDAAITVPLEQRRDEADEPADLWAVFAGMRTIPTLLLRGELSDILTEDCVVRMRAVHPTLAYTQVDCCGHAPLLVERESRVAIDRFLAVEPAAESTVAST